MRYETLIKLDELIIGYENTRQKALHWPCEAERFQQQYRVLCNNVIRPAMEAFSNELCEHGHKVRIYAHERSVEQGEHSRNAELSMHVSPMGGDASADNAHGKFVISFSFDSATHKMMTLVTIESDMPSGYSHPFDLHPVEGVTTELVEQELLEMLRYGFNCARRELGEQKRASA